MIDAISAHSRIFIDNNNLKSRIQSFYDEKIILIFYIEIQTFFCHIHSTICFLFEHTPLTCFIPFSAARNAPKSPAGPTPMIAKSALFPLSQQKPRIGA